MNNVALWFTVFALGPQPVSSDKAIKVNKKYQVDLPEMIKGKKSSFRSLVSFALRVSFLIENIDLLKPML